MSPAKIWSSKRNFRGNKQSWVSCIVNSNCTWNNVLDDVGQFCQYKQGFPPVLELHKAHALWRQSVSAMNSGIIQCSCCRGASVFCISKVWSALDFYIHNDLLMYIGDSKHKVVLAYCSSLIYNIHFMPHQLQQPFYHTATCDCQDVGHSLEPRSQTQDYLCHLFPACWQQGLSTRYCHSVPGERGKPQEEQQSEHFWESWQGWSSSLGYWHGWYWCQLVEWD